MERNRLKALLLKNKIEKIKKREENFRPLSLNFLYNDYLIPKTFFLIKVINNINSSIKTFTTIKG